MSWYEEWREGLMTAEPKLEEPPQSPLRGLPWWVGMEPLERIAAICTVLFLLILACVALAVLAWPRPVHS